jgi:hypothetical protein
LQWYQHGNRGYWHEMDVPPELVPEILSRLALKDRLGMCALVSRAWRAAAVTGTEELVVSFPAAATADSNGKQTSTRRCCNQRLAGLAAFLVRHGGALNSLTVTAEQSAGCLRLALPWQCLRNLRSLNVSQLELVTYSNSSCAKDRSASSTAGTGIIMAALPASHAGNTASELAQLTCLTSLQLEQCVCRGWRSSLSNQLMALKRLQQLSLRLVAEVPAGHLIAAAASAAGKQNEDRTSLAAAVSQLTALQRLHLELEAAGVQTWQVVGSLKFLTQLQELELICLETAGDAVCPAGANICWSDLPSMLTSLTLNSATDAGWQLSCSSSGSSSSSASQCHMTALQKLVLVSHQLQPACLASLPQLAHLSITANVLKPKGSTGLQTLLSVIKEQHQLQVLELNCPADVAVPPAEVELFAALTASWGSLEVLCVSLIDLPDGALEVMFPAGRQFPKLRKLWLGSDGQSDSSTCEEDDEPLLLLPLEPWEVQMVLKCCPVLEHLYFQPCSLDCDLFDEHQQHPSCSPTWAGVAGQMTGIRSLGVSGPGVDDQFTMQLLMQLTGLQDLRVSRSQNLTNSELESLTCLTQLTGLAVRWQQHYMLDDAVHQQAQIYNDPSFSLKNLVRSDRQLGTI